MKMTSAAPARPGNKNETMDKRMRVNGLPATRAGSLSPYQETLRGLSDRLVEAQRPFRILDAIKWDSTVEQAFFAAGCRELPPVTRAYYGRRPLPFDPTAKRQELIALEADVCRRLGKHDPAGQILRRTCREYGEVIDLLLSRGTAVFSQLSGHLYGSSHDRLPEESPSVAGLGQQLSAWLDCLPAAANPSPEEQRLDAPQAVVMLSARLAPFFQDREAVRVRLSDGIVADAAAGSDYIKLRADARFSARDVRLLEVHEGWVHLGTTLNGQNQPVCTFLSKGPPSSTLTQEGLAVLTEVLALATNPARVRRLVNRIEGVAQAEAGADFLDVYRFFLQQGEDARDSYQQTMRIFRGSLPAGCGPFTKDICYVKGFVLISSFLRQAFERGLGRLVPLLFCGKTNLGDLDTLAHLVEEGLVVLPHYLPPVFAELRPPPAAVDSDKLPWESAPTLSRISRRIARG
jgi:uncharacterized protein (TIGR02421 family)